MNPKLLIGVVVLSMVAAAMAEAEQEDLFVDSSGVQPLVKQVSIKNDGPIESQKEALVGYRPVESGSSALERPSVTYGSPNALGFSAGATSGIGFAFRRHFENRFGIHIGAIGVGGTEGYGYWANLGGQLMYTFHRAEQKYFRFYGLAGGTYIISGTEEYDYSQGTSSWAERRYVTLGAGIGMEFMIVQRIGIALELPWSLWLYPGGTFRMLPVPNGALVYFF